MARKAGQIISRGPRTWLVRISMARDKESKTRKYHDKTVHGSSGPDNRVCLRHCENAVFLIRIEILRRSVPRLEILAFRPKPELFFQREKASFLRPEYFCAF